VNVSQINYVCKEFVNRRVTTTQLALNSNIVKTTFVHKKFDAEVMMIVCQMNDVKSIRLDELNVEMRAKDVICAVVMLNVQHEIMMLCVHVNKVLLMMAKADAEESNVKRIMIVVQKNSVIKTFVNWRAKVEKHAAKKRFAQLKIIKPFATANQDTVATHTNNVMPSIIVETNHADQELCVQTTKEHSIVLVATATSEIHTMKDAVWHSNVQAMLTVQSVPNVFKRTAIRNVGMYAKMSAVVRIQNVYQSIMSHSANACRAMVGKLLMQLLDADHFQFHAVFHPIAQPTHTVMAELVSQLVF